MEQQLREWIELQLEASKTKAVKVLVKKLKHKAKQKAVKAFYHPASIKAMNLVRLAGLKFQS